MDFFSFHRQHRLHPGPIQNGSDLATLHYLQQKFSITSFSSISINEALQLGWNDFEDASQMAMAREHGIPYLVTHNDSDFKSTADVTVLSVPALLLKLA
ncbi:MAG: hypothetical protein HC904_07695 [Blastochloris sp.]|nr:hypothetical protein [Blastochloris sp.]